MHLQVDSGDTALSIVSMQAVIGANQDIAHMDSSLPNSVWERLIAPREIPFRANLSLVSMDVGSAQSVAAVYDRRRKEKVHEKSRRSRTGATADYKPGTMEA
jgi:hypothetical protein